MRGGVPGRLLRPDFVGLGRLLKVAGSEAVVGGFKLRFLVIGDPVAQLVCFGCAGGGQRGFAHIEVFCGERAVSPSEEGIESDGFSVVRNSGSGPLAVFDLAGQGVFLQSVERSGGCGPQRNIEFLHGGNGFTELGAQARCSLAQRQRRRHLSTGP